MDRPTKLRLLRQSLGLSQAELGQACGLTQTEVSTAERGLQSKAFFKIAAYLRVDPEGLLDRPEPPPLQQVASE